MSGAPDTQRQEAPGGTPVDQGTRGQDIQVIEDDDSQDDIVASMKRQLAELEAREAEARKQAEEEQRRRLDAEQARRQAEERAMAADQQARQAEATSQRSTASAQLDAVKNALDANQGMMAKLKADYSKAMAEGEFDKAADVQAEMAIVGGKIVTLENGKIALEEQVKAEPQDAGRQQQQPASEYARREAYMQRFTPTIQTWLRGPHGDRFFNDPDFQRRVQGAASYAQNNRNLDPNSQAYIEFIETEVGLRQPQSQGDGTQQQQSNGRGREVDDSRRMTTAPAGGATGGSVRGSPDGDNIVRLSRAEMEFADSQGLTHSEYARHKRDLMRDNLIGPGARR